MRKSLEEVLCRRAVKKGNYSSIATNDCQTIQVLLFTTVICGYDMKKNIYFADNRGFGSSTTSRAVNSCIQWCETMGFKQVTVDEFKKETGAACLVGSWKY